MRIYFILLLILTYFAQAQEVLPPSDGGFTKSMGQPQIYKPYIGFSLGHSYPAVDDKLIAQFRLGVYRDLMNPMYSVLGISAEGYIGSLRTNEDFGFRAMIEMPALRLAGGLDYNYEVERLDFILRITAAVRRGGIFGRGTDLRLEWLPARGNTYNLGIGIPIFQPNRGKTRPKRDYVRLTAPKPPQIPKVPGIPALEEALNNIRESARWINRLTTPYYDYAGADPFAAIADSMKALKKHLNSRNINFPNGRNSEAEVRFFHQELERAFSMAILGESLVMGESVNEGREVAAQARNIILERILYPYNRLLGQKKNSDSILEFAKTARGKMARWMTQSDVIPPERIDAVRYVFQEIIAIIEENRAYSAKIWKDSRLVWLPLQYALLPEQHDSQQELDKIIEGATGQRFTEGNKIWYIINEEFQYEVARQIHAARDYHILWIHDIDAFDAGGDPDTLTFLQIKDSYFQAMIDRIREYDDTGKLPVFMIFLDQFFYQANKTRTWMRLLEKPLTYSLKLSDKSMEQALTEKLTELRRAINRSKLLQAEIQEYGEEWLHNLIKVHVNITNPADISFWSRGILPILGTPDLISRDHRKISFYDVSEEDPYQGVMMIGGMGIGEHYAGPTWDDRGILVQGPAALDLKYAARQLLLDQGFEEQEIPYPLQIRSKASDYARAVQDTIRVWSKKGFTLAKVKQLHNQTGYHPKMVSVANAVMYSLMPRRTFQIIPDSLWDSDFWLAILLGNSLRGGWISIQAPALENAPSAGFPQMSRTQELLARHVVIQEILSEEIEAAGGMFRATLYNPDEDVADFAGQLKEFKHRFESDKNLQELFPFHPSIYRMLDSMIQVLSEQQIAYLSSDAVVRKPKLHAKINLFASLDVVRDLLIMPEFASVFKSYILQRVAQATEYGEVGNVREKAEKFLQVARDWVIKYRDNTPQEDLEKLVFYFKVGTMNQNYRSKVFDGEAVVLISGVYSIYGLMDMIFRIGLTTPIEDLETLEKHLPQYGGTKRAIGRWIRTTL
ncbi:MAG: hypothetical protein JSW33_13515 [bacterium]|nr:MAG: hypothetical protein JSW33_13515 [bacterium]